MKKNKGISIPWHYTNPTRCDQFMVAFSTTGTTNSKHIMFSFASRVSKRRGAEKTPYLSNLETAKNGEGGMGRGGERRTKANRTRKSRAIEKPHVCETELVKY